MASVYERGAMVQCALCDGLSSTHSTPAGFGRVSGRPAVQPAGWSPSCSDGGTTLTRQPDASYLASGTTPEKETYTFTVPLMGKPLTGLKLEVLTDPYVYIADTRTNTIVGKVGPFSKGLRHGHVPSPQLGF